jgi:hypothetical protein
VHVFYNVAKTGSWGRIIYICVDNSGIMIHAAMALDRISLTMEVPPVRVEGGLNESDICNLDSLDIFKFQPGDMYTITLALEEKTLSSACSKVFARFPGSFQKRGSGDIDILRMPIPHAKKCIICPGTNPIFVDYKFSAGWEGRTTHAFATIEYDNGSSANVIPLKVLDDLKNFFRRWINTPPPSTPPQVVLPEAGKSDSNTVRLTANADREYIKNMITSSLRYTFRHIDKATSSYPRTVRLDSRKYLSNIWRKELNDALNMYK